MFIEVIVIINLAGLLVIKIYLPMQMTGYYGINYLEKMLAFSNVNSEMVWNSRTGETSHKSPRYLIINEEIYAEFPIGVNGTDTRHLIPISEMNCNEISAEGKDTETTNRAIQEFSGTKDNCDDDVQVETIASQHKTSSESSSKDVDLSQNSCIELIEDDSSDDMIIISDEELLMEEESVNQTNNKLLSSVNESYQKVAPLIGLLEDNVSNKCSKPNKNKRLKHCHSTDSKTKDELEVDNAKDGCNRLTDKITKRICIKPKYPMGKYEKVKTGDTDHFPIKFNKKFLSPAIDIDRNEITDSEISKTSSKSIEPYECPYCSFKVAKGKIIRHLLQQHIKACFCPVCNSNISCARLEVHSRGHNLRNLRCFKCSFEGNNAVRFKRHLWSAHKDPLVRQCCVCGEWLTKTRSIHSQIEILLEHVKSKHHLQPEEKN